MATLLLMVGALPAAAHDPSAWGGLFRSRDDGASWLPNDAGLFVGAALSVAVSPADATHLLYGTDTRLLRSHNGGRDWTTEAPAVFNGPTLAVAFSPDGDTAWAATAAGVFAQRGRDAWTRVDLPDAASPARAMAVGPRSARLWLLGARGLYASDDSGRRFARIAQDELPDAAGRALLVVDTTQGESVLALLEGRLWLGADGGRAWQTRDAGLPAGEVEAIAADREKPGRLWAASTTQVHVSDDLGTTWRAWGAPIGEGRYSVRAIAAANDGRILALTTHKGLLRSSDAGLTWAQVEGALPVHLEAGPLLRDPHDAQTLYAGFSLVPYAEQRRRAEQGANLMSRVDPVSAAGAAAFLLLLIIGGWLGARRLSHAYRNA